MNRTKIDWTDFTWNPWVGCRHGCEYCYARVVNDRYHIIKIWTQPEYFPQRLGDPARRKKPSKIFVGSMTDQFGPWVDDKSIINILAVVRSCPQHVFQFLTKYPERMRQFEFPDNAWVGTTVDHCSNAERSVHLSQVKARIRFISFEPLLSEMTVVPLDGISWVIIGAMTGKEPISPKKSWVANIIGSVRARHIPVFLKKNLSWPETIQEWPC